MRPFRFFFFFSLAFILFVFLARFVIMAIIAAAALSVLFFIGRKFKHFFQRLDWQDEPHYDYRRYNYHLSRRLPIGKEDFLLNYPQKQREYVGNYRTIEIL